MIALYARVSTREQAEKGYSIGEQVDRLKHYAEAQGRRDSAVYVDAGFSGAKMERPELQRMLSDVRAGKVDKVIVYKLDRLSRSQKDTLRIIDDILLPSGCEFESMSERFDTGSPFGRAMVGILSVFAQLEREQIKERMQIGRDAKAKAGYYRGGGELPTGYDRKDGLLVVNEFEAAQVRELFRRYIGGEYMKTIIDDMNARGLHTRAGKWNRQKARKVLQNPLYIGKFRHMGEIYDGIHEPIITPEEFAEAEKITAIRKQHPHGNGETEQNLLSGLIYCRRCGARYGAIMTKHGSKKWHYYSCYSRAKVCPSMKRADDCRNKIYRRDDLDNIILDSIRQLSVDETAIETASAADSNAEQARRRDEGIRHEIEKIDERRSRLLDLYAGGRFSTDELDAKIEELNARKSALFSELSPQTDKIPIDAAKSIIRDFRGALADGNTKQIRLIAESLIDRVEIDGDDVFIKWKF